MSTILLEISKQYTTTDFYNYSPFVYYKRMFSDIQSITDDYGIEGYYNDFQFETRVNIFTVQVDIDSFVKADTLNQCQTLVGSFFWNYEEQKLYIHFLDNNRQFEKEILVGIVLGYSNKFNETTENIYNSILYDERLLSVGGLKKNIDPMFYGLLKYNSSTAKLINLDGNFDGWNDESFYGTEARILYSDNPQVYEDFAQIGAGFLSDNNITSKEFSIKLDDPRKGLEQPTAQNTLTVSEFASLPDSSKNAVKPVVYGNVYYRKCIETNTATHEYIFCDTEYNTPSSLVAVRDNTGVKTPSYTSLSDGIFRLSAAPDGDVYASFNIAITNGVDIIKDLMYRYDNKNYLSTFWDITEVDAARALCQNTSLHIADTTKLSAAIEKVCFDCDLRFFLKHNGKYTIRKYDYNRVPVASILWDDWLDEFAVKNTGSEYLTDCTVQYQKDEFIDGYRARYKNTTYQSEAFDKYKKYKTKSFESGLYTETAAIAKSTTIMQYSSNISDIVDRSVNWNFKDLELCDFVYASPKTRVKDAENEILSVYEVIGIEKNLDKKEIKLTLRYVKEA